MTRTYSYSLSVHADQTAEDAPIHGVVNGAQGEVEAETPVDGAKQFLLQLYKDRPELFELIFLSLDGGGKS